MSTATLIIGESGTGKSSAMRNLDPQRTLLIQSVKKRLPFTTKGTDWAHRGEEHPAGNIFVTDDSTRIVQLMRNTSRKIIVLDDWQYILANEFMRRSDERGFDKFTDIGRHAWDVIRAANDLADDVRVYILAHSQSDELGRVRTKTIGKLLDEKITVEGMFTIVLRTIVRDGQYFFSTNNSGLDTVKSPIGLFDKEFIENDLAMVDGRICDYYEIGFGTKDPEKLVA